MRIEFENLHPDVVTLLEGLADLSDEFDCPVMIWRDDGQIHIGPLVPIDDDDDGDDNATSD